MTVTKRFPRRAFLAGTGVAVSLPFLPSIMTRSLARAQECAPAKRFIAYYVPNGFHMQDFTPDGDGTGFTLRYILQPLETLKSKMLVLTGIENRNGRFPGDPAGDHGRGTGAFLTCEHPVLEGVRVGRSADQLAVDAIGDCTRFASLQLGMDGGGDSGSCDSGYSCAYQHNISFAGPSSPLNKTTDPRAVFDRLFEGFDPDASVEEAARRRHFRTSVLDRVMSQADRLNTRLGVRDRQKLDEYMTAVRAIEQRIEREESAPVCEPPGEPGSDMSVPDRFDAMTELMALAIQCDATRVISFMAGNGGSGRSYDFIGVSGGHHDISHHMDQQANFDKLRQIGRFEIEQVAKLAMRLDGIDDGGGKTVLDNTVIYLSSEISDGNAHNHDNMPVLMLGSLGDSFRTGRHVRYSGSPPMANLFLSILQAMGSTLTRFGTDGTGPLPQL